MEAALQHHPCPEEGDHPANQLELDSQEEEETQILLLDFDGNPTLDLGFLLRGKMELLGMEPNKKMDVVDIISPPRECTEWT